MKRPTLLTLALLLLAGASQAHEIVRTYATLPPCDAGQYGPTILLTDASAVLGCAAGSGSYVHHCTCENGTWVYGAVAADSLDFTEFKDAMATDAATTVDLTSGDLTLGSLTITAAGDVGIGASPTTVFYLKRPGLVLPYFESTDNSVVQLRLKTGNANRRIIATNSLDVQQSQIVLGDAGAIQFGSSTLDNRLVITAAADVGVGTASPAAKLDVEGTIQADDITCEAAGCIGTTEVAGLDISDDTNLAATSPIVLTGDTLSFSGAVVPSGSVLVFFQAACPSGWTKITTAALDGAALRGETGTGGGTGGSRDISAAATGSHVVTTTEMPAHTHGSVVTGGITTDVQAGAGTTVIKDLTSGSSGSTGGGSGHDHPLLFAYANVIFCQAP